MIYLVEDDKSIRELVVYTLNSTGFKASGFCDVLGLREALKETIPQLILLDIMLPNKDGIEILKELKENHKTEKIPVIFLTAKSSEFDKVTGLDLGADDYITKPFGMMEMVSRVKAVLRRYKTDDTDEIVCSNIRINKKKHLIYVNSQEISLPFKEYELLKVLMENRGNVLSRDNLLNLIWGYSYDGESRTVDVHIRTLRQKLGDEGDIIKTIRNVGYKIGD